MLVSVDANIVVVVFFMGFPLLHFAATEKVKWKHHLLTCSDIIARLSLSLSQPFSIGVRLVCVDINPLR